MTTSVSPSPRFTEFQEPKQAVPQSQVEPGQPVVPEPQQVAQEALEELNQQLHEGTQKVNIYVYMGQVFLPSTIEDGFMSVSGGGMSKWHLFWLIPINFVGDIVLSSLSMVAALVQLVAAGGLACVILAKGADMEAANRLFKGSLGTFVVGLAYLPKAVHPSLANTDFIYVKFNS